MMTGAKLRVIVRSIIASYMITGGLLLLTAFLIYRMEPQQSMISAGILVIYVLSSFFGGFLAGKGTGNKKFLWGMLTGTLYFALLFCVSWISGNGIHSQIAQILTTLLLCVGGGAVGGMLA